MGFPCGIFGWGKWLSFGNISAKVTPTLDNLDSSCTGKQVKFCKFEDIRFKTFEYTNYYYSIS